MRRQFAGALLALALAGCGGSASVSTPGSPAATPTPTATTTESTGGAPTRVATYDDDGTTIHLQVGDRLRVDLASTYWHFEQVSGGALRAAGPPIVDPKPSGCVPGQGCGTASSSYVAAAPGSADVVATRTSCGEAMACDRRTGRYVLHVEVR